MLAGFVRQENDDGRSFSTGTAASAVRQKERV
jgi:hypothetical protein